jgi:hypothetical protein
MKMRITLLAILVSLGLGTSLIAQTVGPGTINWKGIDWTVDVNATANVNTLGQLEIEVGGDTGDPQADNWNVHTALSSLFTSADYASGAWVEISFLDAGPDNSGNFGGGPRAYLDTWERPADDGKTREYMFQGGMYDGYSSYYVNTATYVAGEGWENKNWYSPGARVAGEHTFKALLNSSTDTVNLWYDGVWMGEVTGTDVPTFFETAFLGVTSNGLEPGGPGFGVYTDFQHGVVPLPAAVWGGLALLGTLGAGRAVRRRLA